jgi:predicted KAP-like P-loop ATPase
MATPRLSPDTPIADKNADVLGRSTLAALIAAEVTAAPPDSGIVIGLMGPWGSGKTSVLNLVESELAEDVEVLRFNPWWFSGAPELLTRFFAELAAVLRNSDDEQLRAAAGTVLAYGSAIAPLLKLAFGARGEAVGELITGAGEADIANQPSARDQYEGLRAELSRSERRIVVVVDDIDRLTPDEIREVVRLVKLVGELPNVSYLLAFDRRRVEAALDDGRAYLEKIIQVPHDLPFVAPATLRQIAVEQLQANLGDLPLRHFDQARWAELFGLGIAPMLTTMRDAKRYANIAPAALALVGDEVASEDILALEGLRIFEPDVYAALPRLAEVLTDSAGLDFRDDAVIEKERRALVDDVLKDAVRLEPTNELMQALFPAAGHLFGGSRYGGERAWRRERRVASREVLDIYLAKALGDTALATARVQSILQAIAHPDELRRRLDELGPRQLPSLLDRLRDYHDDLPSDPKGEASLIFMELEDRLPDPSGMFEMPSSWAIHAVVGDLLQRLELTARPDTVTAMYEAAPSLSIKRRILVLFGTFSDREDRTARILDADMTNSLTAQLRHDVVTASPSQLAQEPDLPYLLSMAIRDHEEDVRPVISEKAADQELFAALLAGVLTYGRRSSGRVTTKVPRLDWDGLASLLDESALASGLAALAERRDELDEHLQLALELAERRRDGGPQEHED